MNSLLENWVQRICVALLAAISFGIPSIAQGQFAGQASLITSHSDYVSQCGCQTCPTVAAGARAPCQGCNGKVGALVSGVKRNAAMLSHRETPPGNMGLHFPYQATQMYYYRRPYNDFHVPPHIDESRSGPNQSTFGDRLGYSNQIFDQVHKSSEEYHNAQYGAELEKDGLLEFVDWKGHQQKRLIWEAAPRYQSEHRNAPYPPLDEEVRNRGSVPSSSPNSGLGSGTRSGRNPATRSTIKLGRSLESRQLYSAPDELQNRSSLRRVGYTRLKSPLYERE